MEGQWTGHLHAGMAYINAVIKHKYEWVIPAHRENDQHIMDIFLDSLDNPVQALEPLNFTRYFVEATTLAEITTSDGKRIHPDLIHPEQVINKEKMRHRHNPTQRLWQDSLRVAVCNHERVLHRPLGKWFVKNKQWQHWCIGNSYTSNTTMDGESMRL
eukprot:10973348-Ditylum_brightwellii.AAC.1